jgi:hypothetical protein
MPKQRQKMAPNMLLKQSATLIGSEIKGDSTLVHRLSSADSLNITWRLLLFFRYKTLCGEKTEVTIKQSGLRYISLHIL